jgi:uncharacterized lipoprotein YddW (UPF0748 family)
MMFGAAATPATITSATTASALAVPAAASSASTASALAVPATAAAPAAATSAATPAPAAAPASSSAVAAANKIPAFRAAWVCSVLNLDFPSQKGLGNAALKREIDAIVKKSAELKLTALIVQVRPSGDALYKSELFPWSEYLSGTQGVAPKDGFDPLAYWIEQAHKNGLELHAWLNPYRITHPTAKITDVAKLANNNPAKMNPSRVIEYKDALYYDPGIYENKKLIINGVAEIIKNYDVDGIHLDDYFYPASDFPDDATYAKYGNGIDKGDWRRGNVNDVIKGIQRIIRRQDKNVRFGVSPFGIWRNASSSPLGSDTSGNESYRSMYADTRRWVKSGWLDYICPQIYWYQGFEIADYAKLLDWWAGVCKGTGVDLYIGHAAYREAEASANDAIWSGEIIRQLKLNARKYPDIVKGSVFFRYDSLTGDLGRQIAKYFS